MEAALLTQIESIAQGANQRQTAFRRSPQKKIQYMLGVALQSLLINSLECAQAPSSQVVHQTKQRSESPRSPEESLYLGTRAAVGGSPSVRQSAAH